MNLIRLIKVAFGSMFFSQALFAGELLNVGLRVNLKYETFGEACQLRDLFRHYDLSLEIKDGDVSRAQLTKLNVFGPPQALKLKTQELASLDVRTENNLSWIKSFSASPEVLKQLINTAEGLGRSDSCKPPQDLLYDDLDFTHFDFGIEEVGYILPSLIDSKPITVRGQTTNGDPFRIEIKLTQDRT